MQSSSSAPRARSAYDAVIIGGGPSGSTAATLLAQAGLRPLVLEREVFPRFHIGESLLPCDVDLLDRLGVTIEHAEGTPHLLKRGAEFYDERAGEYAEYPFEDSLEGTAGHAFQVDRASFDLRLLEGAERAGAVVHQGEKVTGVSFDDAGVSVQTAKGTHHARYLIDATGQDSFLARQNRTRQRIDEFGIAAVFRHFDGLKPEIAEELRSHGNIKILFVDDGWLWAIPLGQGRLSVGFVTRQKGITDGWLDCMIEGSEELSRLLDGATASGPHSRIGSFSFHNERPHGARWVCVGDAACFLDPVFSSGVSFGMLGSAHAMDALIPALRAGNEADPALMDAHAAHMSAGYSVFATLIRSFYERRLLPGLFFTKDQDAELRRGLTSVLAGDVWRDDNRFQERLWASKRRRFEIPGYQTSDPV
ncbi:MAG: NAD(P)/FAD-dependent oxidoreductase [Sandaracinaceae bacterium]